MKRGKRLLASLALYIFAGLFINSLAQSYSHSDEFVISLSSKPTSLDPHLFPRLPSVQLSSHIFDTIYFDNQDGSVGSHVIEKTSNDSDKVWMFKVKQGITFHNGELLTARDIVYSINRILSMDDSGFKAFLGGITPKLINEYEFQITTEAPRPTLQYDLSTVFILKATDEDFVLSEELNEGDGLIGTGPYRFIQQDTVGNVRLELFPEYHQTLPYVKKVKFEYEADRGKRLQSFKAGNSHFLEKLTPNEVDSLRKDDKFKFVTMVDDRLLHLHIDSHAQVSSCITGNDGLPMKTNPLQDKRVRLALSKAIDRERLIKEVLDNAGKASGQFVSDQRHSHDPALKPVSFDLEGARALMKEAGFSEGFRVTLHGPKNRYIKDSEILKAIGAMWDEIGVITKPKTYLKEEYFPKAIKNEFSISLAGYSTYGKLPDMLIDLIATKTKDKSMGYFNFGRYSNPNIDQLIQEGRSDFNLGRRMSKFEKAAELAIKDVAIIPLYFEMSYWAVRSDMTYWPKHGGRIIAAAIKPLP